MLDVGLGAVGVQMLEPVLHRYTLRQRRIELQVLLNVRQAEEDQVEELALGHFEVQEPPELLHDLPGGEHLRLVDQDHGLLPGLVNAHEALVQLSEQGQLRLAGRLHAELKGHALEQPGGGHAAVDDHQQRGFVLVLRERVEQPARERRLPRSDVSDQDPEALHLRAQMREPHQRLGVLWRVEVEARDRRVGEGLLGQLVVVEIVHQTKPILRFLRAGSGGGSGSRPPPGRDPAVGPEVPCAATLRGEAAGAAGRFAISRDATLTRPDRFVIRAATSRKPGSSPCTAWYCSSASALSPRAS